MSELVTIGIPFFNSRTTLGSAIRSVLAQTHTNWQLILMDDGSTDGSLGIAQSFSDGRISVISDGSNRGLVYRLNQISQMAEGSLVARMDSDDIMHPERLREQVAYLMQNHECDMVSTAAYIIDESNNVIGVRGLDDGDLSLIGRIRQIIHPSVMARKDWMIANPYDPLYVRGEDFELWCRTASCSRFHMIRLPLMYYRDPLSVRVGPYKRSLKTARMTYRKYGSDLVGKAKAYQYMVMTHVRSAAVSTLAAVGATEMLVNRRAQAISADRHSDAKRGLLAAGA